MTYVRIERNDVEAECFRVVSFLFCSRTFFRDHLAGEGIFSQTSVDAFTKCIYLMDETGSRMLYDFREKNLYDLLDNDNYLFIPIDKARIISAMLDSVWRLQATQLHIALEPIFSIGHYKFRDQIDEIERSLKHSVGLQGSASFGATNHVFLPIHNQCSYLADCIRHELWKYRKAKGEPVNDWTNDAFPPHWWGEGEAPKFNISIVETVNA